MAFSKITITFNRTPIIGEYVNFTIENPIDALTYADEECAAHRTVAGFFNYNADEPDVELSTYYYYLAWKLDYNSTNLYTVTFLNNTVTIEAKDDNYTFSAFASTGGATAVITNGTPVTLFNIVSVDFSAKNTNQCNQVSVDVTCDSEVTKVISPVSIIGNTGNTVSFDWVRGASFTLQVSNGTTTRSQSVTTPAFLADPTVSVLNSPSGATVSIFGDLTFTLQYSLDGTTWQSKSTFSGLTEGAYVAYIKDDYGCIKTTNFDVDEFTTQITLTEPTAYISNTNALRFKKDEVWDNKTIYKNDYNTLSCEEDVPLPNLYVQEFLFGDQISTQIKTNYENITTTITDTELNITSVTNVKKTDNIGLKDKRDALIHEFDDERFGFYFISGDTYDYDTGVADGTYELFGALPSWARIGQYVLVDDTTYYEIVDIVYEESIKANVLVINESLAGEPLNIVAATIYNVFDWDAYEFNIDTLLFQNKKFIVKILLTDDRFDTITFKSEVISVLSMLNGKYKTIEYYNSENNDILFSTGIKFLLRLQYDTFGLASDSEIDIHKTDSYVYSLDSSVYIKKILVLSRLSTMMARKVTQLSALNNITINGMSYTIESVSEPERIGLTNFYNITLDLYENKVELETESAITSINLDDIEIPDLIDSGDGLIEQ